MSLLWIWPGLLLALGIPTALVQALQKNAMIQKNREHMADT